MNHFSRRTFLGSAASGALLASKSEAYAQSAGAPPWDGEKRLLDAAESTTIEKVLSERCPHSSDRGERSGPAMLFANPNIQSSVWGPANRITVSMIKNDVFDRRVIWVPPVTLKQIHDGAFSPRNKGFDDQIPGESRPMYGVLMPEGGRREPYAYWRAYAFPCQKPVGQVIIGMDDMEGAAPPKLSLRCKDGVLRIPVVKGDARADLELAFSMTSNVLAVRGRFSGLKSPLWLRVYRHRDQSHRMYMTADGLSFQPPSGKDAPAGSYERAVAEWDYEKDRAVNRPMEAPESGRAGNYFWIRQRMPAEKTFPKGFEYVLMGLVSPRTSEIETADGRVGLGTPPHVPETEDESRPWYDPTGHTIKLVGVPPPLEYFRRWYNIIREAPGSAATTKLPLAARQEMTAYLAVVTSIDATDIIAEAKSRLATAEAAGYERLVAANAAWYGELYDRRENGRVFYGGGIDPAEEVRAIFRSWPDSGPVKADMRRYQASAGYAAVEQESQQWHGIMVYNESYTTDAYVRNRADTMEMWKYIVEHWLPAGRANVREVFDMPGGCLLHGYLPPIKPDRYVHTNSQLELCLDTGAQILKHLWDEWDYGGDERFLREKVYPAMRDLATFYAAYVQKGADGRYHIIPSVEAESWGVYPEYSRTKDVTSAITTFRWTFQRMIEASELLGVDAGMRPKWKELASNLVAYPMHMTAEGPIIAGTPGVAPPTGYKSGDHGSYIGVYPATLTDEINLDSESKLRELMVRTACLAPLPSNFRALVLMGACPDRVANTLKNVPPRAIEDVPTLQAEVNRACERLLNSRGGRIHLFPCVPAWAAVAFHRFQARGAFLVSAAKTKDGVSFVEIEARRNIPCRLMNPWPGSAVTVREGARKVNSTMDRSNGECVIFPARAGGRYAIARA
jgi:hypothetical protein